MQSSVEGYMPIRVGAIVPMGGAICAGCLPDVQHPHIIPGNRFALLVYMPVMTKAPPQMRSFPFIGGIRTPPREIDGVQTMNNPGAEHFFRMVHCN